METETKNVGTAVPGKESATLFETKGSDDEEGPVSIEPIAEDESSSGKAVPTRVPVDDKPVEKSRPTLERVSVQNQRNESAHVPADAPNVSRDEKEAVSHQPVSVPVAGVGKLCLVCGKDHGLDAMTCSDPRKVVYSHLSPGLAQSGASWMPTVGGEQDAPRKEEPGKAKEEAEQPSAASEGTPKLCRCDKDHGPAIADMVRFMFGNAGIERDPVKMSEAIAERDPVKLSEAMYGSLPSVWGKQTTVSNARETKDGDKADPVSERFGLYGKPAPSGDTEKLDPMEKDAETPVAAYPNVARYNAKYGFHKEDKGDDEKKDQSTTTGEGEEPCGLCGLCGEIHAKKPRFDLRFFILREGTQTAKNDEKVADKDSTTTSRTTKFLTYDEISAILGQKGRLTDEDRVAHNAWKLFRFEQERRVGVATNDMKRAATCKGPEQTFEILAMLTETKRYVKRDEGEPEYFPQWLYYALKKLISIAKKIVMTKNKHECSRLARSIDQMYSNPRKEDTAAIKILGYAKGAVTIIAGEVALTFLEK